MLSPLDKLKSGVNDIIQIVVTTSCTLNCSNCTQLLPFRKDYLHMSLECFEEAVKSVAEWPGVVALFGGNPCSHPRFPDLCRILKQHIPEQRRRGLWSNDLLKHGEVARDTFYPYGRFNLNAHGNELAAIGIEVDLPDKLIPGSDTRHSMHAPILASFADLGVSAEEFIEAREHCDINQKWSGAIVERNGKPFAYFCEIAAAIDGVRGTNNGIPAYPGWWAHQMPVFESQVYRCCNAGCAVPLRLKARQDDEEVYDMTKEWGEVHKVRGPVSRHVLEVPKRTLDHYPDEVPELPRTHEVTDYMGTRRPHE